MTIQTFKNMKGLIFGKDTKRIECAKDGVLKIGSTEIPIAGNDVIMPVLFHGCTGVYEASFTDTHGKVYRLEDVTIKGGRIVPPSPTAVQIMELQCRAEFAEQECEYLRERIRELSNIFDTDSLNFLIK